MGAAGLQFNVTRLTRLFVGGVGAVGMSIAAVRGRVADVVVDAEELVVRAHRRVAVVAVLLVRVVGAVLEEIAAVQRRDAPRAVGACHLALLARQPRSCTPTGTASANPAPTNFHEISQIHTHTHTRLTALFPGLPR